MIGLVLARGAARGTYVCQRRRVILELLLGQPEAASASGGGYRTHTCSPLAQAWFGAAEVSGWPEGLMDGAG